MSTKIRIQSALRWPHAPEILSYAQIMPVPKPNRAGFPARLVCALVGAFALLLAAVAAQAATLTYNFNDGLQCWTQIGTSSKNPWNSGGNAWGQSQAGSIFGYDGDDGAHATYWVRSPEFYLDGSGPLSVRLWGGPANAPAPANVTDVPADAISGGGFKGVALRDVATGNYVQSLSLANGGDNGTYSLTVGDLAGYANDGKTYTLDYLDYDFGGWGWVGLDDVSIPGDTALPGQGKDIKSFTFPTFGDALVSGCSTTITMQVPYRTDVTALAPTYTLSAQATCVPASGSPQNFASPVHYIVTAADSTTKDYTVTVTVRPPTVAYDFNDGTLQGWHNRVWDTNQNSGAGAWVDLAPNVSTMPLSINGGVLQPPSGNDNLFGNSGTQVDPIGGSTDNHLNTLWLRSPVFKPVAGGDVTVQMARGMAHGSAPANDASVSYIANGTTGWKGVALRRDSDGVFVLAKPRTSEGDAMVTVTFAAAELAPYLGVACTLDLINSENGGWGWLSMDNVYITGNPVQVTLAAADPSILVGNSTTVVMSIPSDLNASAPATVYVTNSNPGALSINGSTDPAVPVVFAAGGPVSQTFTVTGLAPSPIQLTAGYPGLLTGSLTLNVYPPLLGHWISGAPNLSDMSGFRPAGTHDGVAVGGSATLLAFSSDLPPGGSGQSLDLRAGNVGVLVTNSATGDGGYVPTFDDSIATKFTVAFWAKGYPAPCWNPWVSKNGEPGGWQLRELSCGPCASFTMRGQPNEDFNGSTINVNDTEWHHFAGVWDGINGFRTLYVDGVVSYTEGNMKAPMRMAAGSHLMLGARDNGGLQAWFSGLLYDVRIYSYPLSQDEVRGLIPSAVKLAVRPAVPVGGNTTLTVSIPSYANASVPVTVYLTNGNPTLVDIGGSTASVVPVSFTAGGASSQTLTLDGLIVGQAGLSAGAAGMASAVAGVTVYPAITTPGLIGHWLAGAPHLADISGFTPNGAHDGTFIGVPPTGNFTNETPLGRPGQSLDLRGAPNIAVRINNSRNSDAGYLTTYDDDIATKFSVAFWAKGFPDTWAPWVSKFGENDGVSNKGWQLRRYGGNSVACFTVRGLANEDGGGSTINVNDNNWHHYVGVWDGEAGTRSLYVDGMLSHTIDNNFAPMSQAPAAHLALGARGDTSDNYGAWFKGLLFDVRLYSTALAGSDVVDLVGAVLASPPALSLVSPSPNTNFITLTVPSSVVAASAVNVVVTSDKPGVAIPEGAVGGALTVTLPMGGPNTASFAVQATGPGTAHFTYSCSLLPSAATTTIAVQQPNINGLVAYWNFDNQTLAETSGFQAAGTHDGVAVGNVAYVPGRLGGYAVDLRAANTAVRIKNSTVNDSDYRTTFDAFQFGSPNGFSWSCWVKGLPVSDWASWIAKDGEAAGYAIRKAGGSDITFTLRNSDGNPDDPTAAAARITDDLWHHLTAVYDPVALQRRLYLDGVECINIPDGNLVTPPTGSPLFFGARDSSGDARFARTILDEVRAYDKALSVEEITAQVGPPMISLTPGQVNMNVGDPDVTATITVPVSMVATSAVTVTITSANPAVATLVGSVGGSLTFNFLMGGANTATATVHGVGVGTTMITATSPSGIINGEIAVTVTATPVLLGHWLSGAADLVETSGYRPAGTHDGVAIGANAALLAFSTDLPANFTGQSLDLTAGGAGNVGMSVANSANRDAGYQPTFDTDIAAKFSIAFWAKGMPPTWAGWVTKYGEPPGGHGWQLRRMGSDNAAGFTIRGIDNEDGTGSPINVNDDNWHHFVGTWDQATGTRMLYVDGVYSHTVYNNPSQVMSQAPGAHVLFGALEDENGNYYTDRWVNCLLFDVRIYNSSISEYRIQSLLIAQAVQPVVSIQAAAGNNIVISWTPAVGTLYASPAVAGPSVDWQSVGTGGSVTLAITPTPRFFKVAP